VQLESLIYLSTAAHSLPLLRSSTCWRGHGCGTEVNKSPGSCFIQEGAFFNVLKATAPLAIK